MKRPPWPSCPQKDRLTVVVPFESDSKKRLDCEKMHYSNEVRATVALVTGSMTTLDVADVHPPVKKRLASSRSNKHGDGAQHQKHTRSNSYLGLFNLFGREKKTPSAVFHTDEEDDLAGYTSAPGSSSHLPYPLSPANQQEQSPPAEVTLPVQPPTKWAVYKCLAVELHTAAELDDELAVPYYDDLTQPSDLDQSLDALASHSLLIRQVGIRRKERTPRNSSNQLSRSCNIGLSVRPRGDTFKRNRSVPGGNHIDCSESDGGHTSSDGDAADHHKPPRPLPPEACEMHPHMSQYISQQLQSRLPFR